jgi:hypothetical protein
MCLPEVEHDHQGDIRYYTPERKIYRRRPNAASQKIKPHGHGPQPGDFPFAAGQTFWPGLEFLSLRSPVGSDFQAKKTIVVILLGCVPSCCSEFVATSFAWIDFGRPYLPRHFKAILMRKKEKLPPEPVKVDMDPKPDDQIINDLIQSRKLQQDALKKIIVSMDKTEDYEVKKKSSTKLN